MPKLSYIRSQIDCAKGKTYELSEKVCSKWSIHYRVVATDAGLSVIETAEYLGYSCSGQRSLTASIVSPVCSDLGATIKVESLFISLGSSLGAIPHVNLSAQVLTQLPYSYLQAVINTVQPVDIIAAAKTLHLGIFDLRGCIRNYNNQYDNLNAVMSFVRGVGLSATMSLTYPVDLRSISKGVKRKYPVDMPSDIAGICPGYGDLPDSTLIIEADSCDEQALGDDGASVYTIGDRFIIESSWLTIAYLLRYTQTPSSLAQPLSRYFTNITSVKAVSSFRVAYAYGQDYHEGGGCYCQVTLSNPTQIYTSPYLDDFKWGGSYYPPNSIKDIYNNVYIAHNPHNAQYYKYSAVSDHIHGYMNYSKVCLCVVVPDDDVTVSTSYDKCEGQSAHVFTLESLDLRDITMSCPLLWASIEAHLPVNLSAAVSPVSPINIQAIIGAIEHKNIRGIVTSVVNTNIDLEGFIRSTQAQHTDLNSVLSSVPYVNLGNVIYSIGSVNINAYLHGFMRTSTYLSAYLSGKAASYLNLSSLVSSVPYENIVANIGAIPSSNLKSEIHSYAEQYLPVYIKSTVQTNINITSNIHSVPYTNLAASVRSGVPNLLYAYVNVISLYDLPATIRSLHRSLSNLQSSLDVHRPKDINASIYSIASCNLSTFTYAVSHRNIKAFVRSYLRNNSNVIAAIRASYKSSKDIASFIFAIKHRNINANLYPIPPTDISAYIYSVSPVLLSSLLRANIKKYTNIRAFTRTNYTDNGSMPAFASSVAPIDLTVYIQTVLPVNLPVSIFSITYMNLTGFIRNIKTYMYDLQSYIKTRYGGGVGLNAGVLPHLGKDLSTFTEAVPHKNIIGIVKVFNHRELNVTASIVGYCGGGNEFVCPMLNAYLVSVEPKLLMATLYSISGVALNANILPSTSGLLRAKVHGVLSGSYDLKTRIQPLDNTYISLLSNIESVPYSQLVSYLYGNKGANIFAVIRGFYPQHIKLGSFIRPTLSHELNIIASTLPVPSVNLISLLNAVPYHNLNASLFITYPLNLKASIYSKVASYKNLYSYIIGPHKGSINILASVVPISYTQLSADVVTIKPYNLGSLLLAVIPYNIKAVVTPVHKNYADILTALRVVKRGHIDLSAFIESSVSLNLLSNIFAIPHFNLNAHVSTNLNGLDNIHSIIRSYATATNNLHSVLNSIPYSVLSTNINAVPHYNLIAKAVSIKPVLLWSYISGVPSVNLLAAVKRKYSETGSVLANIRGYMRGYTDLTTTVSAIPYVYLNSYLNTVPYIGLSASLRSTSSIWLDVRGIIKPVWVERSNIGAFVYAVYHRNIKGIIEAVPHKNIQADIYSVPYTNLESYVSVLHRNYSNLVAALKNIHNGNKDLGAYVSINAPVYLNACLAAIEHQNFIGFIRAYNTDKYNLVAAIRKRSSGVLDITSVIGSIPSVDLKGFIGIIESPKLKGVIRGTLQNHLDINSYIKGKVKAHIDFPAYLQSYRERYLSSTVNTTLPININAYIKPYSQISLEGIMHGYAIRHLGSSIGTHLPVYLNAYLRIYVMSNINGFIFGWGSSTTDIDAYLKAGHQRDMNAFITKYFFKSSTKLSAALSSVPIYLLYSSIVGWDTRDISAAIQPVFSKDFLHAIITPHGGYRGLDVKIVSLLGRGNLNLNTNLSGYAVFNLTSTLQSIPYNTLNANLNVKGGSKALIAFIDNTASYFNEVYNLNVSNYSNLRATVGYTLCTTRTTKSSYTYLYTSISSLAVYNLFSSITCVSKYTNGSVGLGAKINIFNKFIYNQSYFSKTEQYKVGSGIRVEPTFNKNSLNLTFKVINGYANLITSLNGLPPHLDMKANIQPILLSVSNTSSKILYTEYVGVLEQSRLIEDFDVSVTISFRNKIYYTNGLIFTKEIDTNLFNIDFFKLKDEATLNTYRLDNKFYNSSDEAIRYGISRVSGLAGRLYLKGTINPVVKLTNLSAYVNVVDPGTIYLKPYIQIKQGVTSAIGCYSNLFVANNVGTLFGGIQDMTAYVNCSS